MFSNFPTTSVKLEYFEVCKISRYKGVHHQSTSTVSHQNGEQYLINALRANIVACRIQSSADDSEVVSPFSELFIVTCSLWSIDKVYSRKRNASSLCWENAWNGGQTIAQVIRSAIPGFIKLNSAKFSGNNSSKLFSRKGNVIQQPSYRLCKPIITCTVQV